MPVSVTYSGGPIFDGYRLHKGHAARWINGLFSELVPESDLSPTEDRVDLEGAILAPGYVDLQVNGGDGVMLNDAPSRATLERIAHAHRRMGSVRILPTLITDTPEVTTATIQSTIDAIEAGVRGIAGLHLEGPHLSVARKGAHDAALIRPMGADDLAELIEAKQSLPILKVTVAPESVSTQQVAALSEAGIVVSLGHTDASFDTCMAYANAGARCATHLFNAMSQLGNREPGLVGAALASDAVSAGLIADGIHVHPAAMQTAWRAKTGEGRIYLVSDAMAVAGTDAEEFFLGGRMIMRRDGRLTLEDGTLAGADLDLTRAVQVLVSQVGVSLEEALAAATTTPAKVVGLPTGLTVGVTPLTDMICVSPDLSGVTLLKHPA